LSYLFTKVPSILETIAGILLILSILGLIASWVILLLRKKWIECLLSVILSAVIVCVLWFPLVWGAMTGPDGFGKKHHIPDGLAFNLPQESYSGNLSIDSLDIQDYLQIWNGPQGGIYKYDFYYPSLPAGDVFLRCYEVTKNIPLSEERIREKSTVSVDSTYSFSQVVDKKEFTVYEGDWGDYYAARIEVWHRDANTGKEKKLMDKIYRVEGWMR